MDSATGAGDGSRIMFQAQDGRTVIISSDDIAGLPDGHNLVVLREANIQAALPHEILSNSDGSEHYTEGPHNGELSSFSLSGAPCVTSSHVALTPTEEHSYTRARPPSVEYTLKDDSKVQGSLSVAGQPSCVTGFDRQQRIENISILGSTLTASTRLWRSQSFNSSQATHSSSVSASKEGPEPFKVEFGSPSHMVFKKEFSSPEKTVTFSHGDVEALAGRSLISAASIHGQRVIAAENKLQSDSATRATIQKTIIVPTGQDVKKATQQAISHITGDLNRKAAAKFARGQCPEQETVIEITQIATPGEGYFSRENLQRRPNQSRVLNYSLRDNRLCFTPPPGIQTPPSSPHRERTPSPIPMESSMCINGQRTPEHCKVSAPQVKFVTSQTSGFKESHSTELGQSSSVAYIQSDVHASSALGAPPRTSSTSISGPVSLIQSNTPTSCEAGHRNLGTPHSQGLPIVMRGPCFAISQTSNSTAKSSLGDCGGVRRIILANGPSKGAKPVLVKTNYTGASHSSTGGSTTETGFDPGPKDDSLTNIQWLGHMSGRNLPASSGTRSVPHQQQDLRIIATEKQIEKISRECGRKKRPPYSYMHLIQMAICSRVDKRMTLKEIYKWIEDKFPYYKHSPKQGWKNSIRHNLSLYNIFVRQKSTIPGKTGSSYWTLSADVSSKATKNSRYNPMPFSGLATDDSSMCPGSYMHVVNSAGGTPQILQVAPPPSSSQALTVPSMLKPRKGPAPLLPKLPVPTVQAYALIPIPAGMSVMSPQPMVMAQQWPQTQNSNTSFTVLNSSHNSSAGAHLKRTCEFPDRDVSEPNRKHVKIAPKASILGDKSASRLLKGNTSMNASVASTPSLDTTDLQHQLSRIRFDSGIDLRCSSDISSCSDSQGSQERHVKQGLPQPKLYRCKRPRKAKVVVRKDCDEVEAESHASAEGNAAAAKLCGTKLLGNYEAEDNPVLLTFNDSALSESGINDILASIEKDFTSPMRGLLKTPPKPEEKTKLTSTPLDDVAPNTPDWISPIRGVTPPSSDSSQLDSGFFTPEGKLATSTPYRGSSSSHSSRGSGQKSPCLGSLRELGLPGLTPLKSPRKRAPIVGSLGASPQFSLRELGLPGLTPLKTPRRSEQISDGVSLQCSPNHSLSFSNQSFQKLLGDIHLDSMMEDGVDIGNLSFLQSDGSPL